MGAEPDRTNGQASSEPADDISRGVLPTDVRPWLARTMVALFLAAIFAVPAVQLLVEHSRGKGYQALEVFTRRPDRENLHRYEKDIERSSAVKKLVQPQLQLALTRFGRFGSSDVVVGRHGWLFYRPGVEFVTGPAMLDATRLKLRKKELAESGERNPCPDPRPAILAFQKDCERDGVHLVVVPVPDKSMLQPGEMSYRLARKPGAMPTNSGYATFLDELRAAGVDVYDPTPAKIQAGDPARFLRQDTHWAPTWMDSVARGLATHLREKVPAVRDRTHVFRVTQKDVARVGDLVEMLGLPPDQDLYPPEETSVRRVVEPLSVTAWKPSPNADVLLLGDSFSNIFTAPEMGWGDASGFPAQLAYYLGRDVDLLARNGSGATGVRRELAHRPDPLAGKKIVVWEFAVRELVQGNWEVVRLRPSAPASPAGTSYPPEPPLLVEAIVEATSRVPQPYSMPYKDCLTYIRVRVGKVLQGSYPDGQMIVVMWGMKDNVLQPAADLAPGRRLRLQVVPLRQAPLDLGTVRCVDDLDDYEHKPYLALEEHGL